MEKSVYAWVKRYFPIILILNFLVMIIIVMFSGCTAMVEVDALSGAGGVENPPGAAVEQSEIARNGEDLLGTGSGISTGEEKELTTGKPRELPRFKLFSDSSPFNQLISRDAAIDPNSKVMVGSMVEDFRNGFVLMVGEYSAPVYFVDENMPRYDVELKYGEEWGLGVSTMKDVPIPDWAEPASGGEEDESGDQHMVLIDLETRYEYDFWQAGKAADGNWTVGWGNAISIDSDGVFPQGMSARGSGFAFTAGMIWPHELKSGRIDHALAFNYSFPKAGGPVSPATESDGTSTHPGAIPEGACIQLDPFLDLDTLDLSNYEKTIARAMQEYGMILVDSGGENGGIALYAIDPKSVQGNPYQGLLPDENYVSLENIPVDRFRVLELPPQVTDPELEVVPNGFVVME